MNNDKVRPDLPHQVANAQVLLEGLHRYPAVADWSEMGAGKTRTFLRVIRELRRPTLVVGPKINETAVRRAGNETGTGFTYINWEMARTGRTPFGKWTREPISPAKAKANAEAAQAEIDAYKAREEKIPAKVLAALLRGTKSRIGAFEWVSGIGFLVFDEAHRAKAESGQHTAMLRAAIDQRIFTLLASATPPATPLELRALGYALGLHEWDDWFHWCQRNGCFRIPNGGLRFTKNKVTRARVMDSIRAQWAPRCVRTGLREVYPDNALVVQAGLYDVPEAAAFERLTEEALAHYAELQSFRGVNPDAEERAAAEYQKRRQQMELLKVPVLLDLVESAREAGRTVHIFVTYSETIDELKRHLPDFPIISGAREFANQEYRQKVMDDAQWGRIPGVILNSAAGSESISLQDLTGEHPPESLVCPPDSVARFVQLLGRTDRVGGQSVPLARIVLAAGGEEDIYERLAGKCHDLKRLLAEDDLALAPIPGLPGKGC